MLRSPARATRGVALTRSGLLIAVAAVLVLSDAAQAARVSKHPVCPAGRYVVSGGALTAGDLVLVTDAVEVGPSVAIPGLCDPVAAKKRKGNKKGETQISAQFPRCAGFRGAVTFSGKLVEGCAALRGTLRGRIEGGRKKKLAVAVTATLSRCGDGAVDTGAGEACDDANQIAGDGCEPTCQPSERFPVVTTTTTPTTPPTTTTTVPSGIKPVLGIAMVANPDPVVPGGRLTYEVTAINRGPVASAGLVLRLTLPTALRDGVSGACIVSDGGTTDCDVGEDVVWDLGTLVAGASRTVQVSILLRGDLADGATIGATARLVDAASVRVSTDAQVSVVADAILTAALAESADPIGVGETLEYVVRFGNRGAVPLLDTIPTLTLPAGTTVVDAGGATVAAGVATWPAMVLEAGQTSERRLRVLVGDLGAADPLVRVARATVTTASGPPPSRAAVATRVAAPIPLGLVLTAGPDAVGPRGLVTYELTVTNYRSTAASGVNLALTLPTDTDGGFAGACTPSDGGTTQCRDGLDVLWALGTLAGESSRTVQVVVRTASNVDNGQLLHTTARVRDAAGATAHAAVTTAIGTQLLTVALAESADPIAVGETLEYVVRFGNRGAGPLLDTIPSLTLPTGTTVVDAGGATVAAGVATWPAMVLEAGQTSERRLRVLIDDLGAADPLVRVARATVTTASGPPPTRAAVATRVESVIPLGLVLTAGPDLVGLRGLVTYELTVTNYRTTAASGVNLALTLPTGTDGGFAGACTPSDDGTTDCRDGRDVVWALGTLAGESSRTVQVVVRTASDVENGQLLHTTARVRDAAGAASHAAVTTAVGERILTVALAESADPIAAGETLEYVVRFGNRGAVPLLGTTPTLTLPVGTTVVDAGGATVAAGVATWPAIVLDTGQTSERRLRVQIDDLGVADPLVRVARTTVTTASGPPPTRAAVATRVESVIPLELVLTAGPDVVGPRGLVTYELTVTNHRSTAASGVNLALTLPTGTDGGFAGGCTPSDGGTTQCRDGLDVLWALGTLAGESSRTVQVVVRTASDVENGQLLHTTARVRDAAGAAAHAAVTTAVGEE